MPKFVAVLPENKRFYQQQTSIFVQQVPLDPDVSYEFNAIYQDPKPLYEEISLKCVEFQQLQMVQVCSPSDLYYQKQKFFDSIQQQYAHTCRLLSITTCQLTAQKYAMDDTCYDLVGDRPCGYETTPMLIESADQLQTKLNALSVVLGSEVFQMRLTIKFKYETQTGPREALFEDYLVLLPSDSGNAFHKLLKNNTSTLVLLAKENRAITYSRAMKALAKAFDQQTTFVVFVNPAEPAPVQFLLLKNYQLISGFRPKTSLNTAGSEEERLDRLKMQSDVFQQQLRLITQEYEFILAKRKRELRAQQAEYVQAAIADYEANERSKEQLLESKYAREREQQEAKFKEQLLREHSIQGSSIAAKEDSANEATKLAGLTMRTQRLRKKEERLVVSDEVVKQVDEFFNKQIQRENDSVVHARNELGDRMRQQVGAVHRIEKKMKNDEIMKQQLEIKKLEQEIRLTQVAVQQKILDELTVDERTARRRQLENKWIPTCGLTERAQTFAEMLRSGTILQKECSVPQLAVKEDANVLQLTQKLKKRKMIDYTLQIYVIKQTGLTVYAAASTVNVIKTLPQSDLFVIRNYIAEVPEHLKLLCSELQFNGFYRNYNLYGFQFGGNNVLIVPEREAAEWLKKVEALGSE